MAIDRLLSATEMVGLPLDNLLQKQVKEEAPVFSRLRPSVLAVLEHGIEGNNELSLDAEVQREAAIVHRPTHSIERLESDLTISTKAFTLFAKFCLISTSPLPDAMRETAAAAARSDGRCSP